MAFVKLAGPAKIGGKWRKPGETVEVGEDALAGLDDQGLVESLVAVTDLKAAPGVDLRKVDLASLPAGGKLITVSEEQFHVEVAARAEMLAGAVTDAAMEGLENQTRRVEELEGELAAEQVAHDETRKLLAAAQNANTEAKDAPTQTDTPPEQAAETAPKRGAAAKTKG